MLRTRRTPQRILNNNIAGEALLKPGEIAVVTNPILFPKLI
jgi:hypothetical protein